VSEAYKALERDTRGNTIMMFHDQAYLGNLYGVNGYEEPFEIYIVGPTVSISPGNAYLVPKDSPYQTVEDIIQAAANDTRVRVAIQPGGVSEIGYTALKNAVRVSVSWKVSRCSWGSMWEAYRGDSCRRSSSTFPERRLRSPPPSMATR
jgi:tripartite-type tricarboxylate transporter receptor subunit TctC